MNADGSEKAQLTKGSGFQPAWSPDGEQIAYVSVVTLDPLRLDLFVMNADGTGARNLTAGAEGWSVQPSWTPSGEVLFMRNDDLFSIHPDGSGLIRLTTGKNTSEYALSPDGKTLANCDVNKRAIVASSLNGGGAPVILLKPATQFITDGPLAALSWTADGKALAVAGSDLDGAHGSPLYIVNADGGGLSQIPGIDAAYDPAWRPE